MLPSPPTCSVVLLLLPPLLPRLLPPPPRRMTMMSTFSVPTMRRRMPRLSESRLSELPSTRRRRLRSPPTSLDPSPSLLSPSRSSLGMTRPTWKLLNRVSDLSRRTVLFGYVSIDSFTSIPFSHLPFSTGCLQARPRWLRCSNAPDHRCH